MAEPDPTPATSGDEPAPAPRRRPWRRRLAWLLLTPVLAPLVLVPTAVVVLRHVPYAIHERDRPPAPPAEPEGGLRVRYLGVTGYEVTDGETVLLLDPVANRPTIWEMLTGPLDEDPEKAARLAPRADFVLVNHAHHDHGIDAPAIAEATGAVVVGSRSACNLALARGVPEDRVRVVEGGERLELGTFVVDVRAVRHSAILGVHGAMTGAIPPDAGPLWFFEYVQDGTFAYRLEAAGTSVWFHPTATHAEGELGGLTAATLIAGVSGEPVTAEHARALVEEAQPRRVLPTHYDNFFQPREEGLALLPGTDLEAARAHFLAAGPGLEWWVLDYDEVVHLPPDGEAE